MKRFMYIIVVLVIGAIFLLSRTPKMGAESTAMDNRALETPVIVTENVDPNLSSATFAAGCFWCAEAYFQETPGVKNVVSGYAGGKEYNPTYEDVYTETTGHREAVRVYYDPSIISYQELVDKFWKIIDPTDSGGQFVDRGPSYTTAIFYENADQKSIAEMSKTNLENSHKFSQPIVTSILPFSTFYQAEDYHQDFYKKSSERYNTYKENSGREEFKAQVWSEIQKQN